jgi:hypothetical protein
MSARNPKHAGTTRPRSLRLVELEAVVFHRFIESLVVLAFHLALS